MKQICMKAEIVRATSRIVDIVILSLQPVDPWKNQSRDHKKIA